MAKHQGSQKTARQIELYDYIVRTGVFGPKDIMRELGISRRTLQRDLKDLRDCGLVDLKYQRKNDRYAKKEAEFDDSSEGLRRNHLIKLYRLGTLVAKLPKTATEDLENYESAVREFEEFVEYSKEDPTVTEEDIKDYREYLFMHCLDISEIIYDLKKEYYELFPDSSERTRQRDFSEMRYAGFDIYYSQRFHSYIFEYDDRID